MFLTHASHLVRKSIAVLTVLATLTVAAEVQAGWYTKYTGGGKTSSGSSGGGSSGGGGVPEIDAGSAAGAVSLLVGGIFLLRDRFNRTSVRSDGERSE